MSIDFSDLDKQEKKIVVSNEFVDIYKKFNVSEQVDKMNKLTNRELYLLLILCVDLHSEDDPVCLNNYKPFTAQIIEINDVQDDKEAKSQTLKDLIEETNDRYIDIDILVDSKGDVLPQPLEKSEVREAKIGNILDKPE